MRTFHIAINWAVLFVYKLFMKDMNALETFAGQELYLSVETTVGYICSPLHTRPREKILRIINALFEKNYCMLVSYLLEVQFLGICCK